MDEDVEHDEGDADLLVYLEGNDNDDDESDLEDDDRNRIFVDAVDLDDIIDE